jgi:predicted dehydrogenase
VVSFPLRVSPLCELARQLIADNAIGKPVHVAAINYVPYGAVYWEQEYRNYRITQGLFIQKATHDLDYISYLMNERIVRVAATATYQHVFGGKKPANLVCSKCSAQLRCLESPRNRRRNLSEHTNDHSCVFSAASGTRRTGTNEDCSSALLEFESGAHGVYTQVFFSRRDAGTRGATLSGYLGTISFDWYTNILKRVRHHEPYTDTIRAGEGLSHFGGDTELARDFIALIRGHIRKSRTPIETGIQSIYTCLAAKESLATGRFVNVRRVKHVG